jgi:hypothetical protein
MDTPRADAFPERSRAGRAVVRGRQNDRRHKNSHAYSPPRSLFNTRELGNSTGKKFAKIHFLAKKNKESMIA